MRSKKVYFQEVKPIKLTLLRFSPLIKTLFLVFGNKNYLTLLFIGPSITPVVKQELVYNLLPWNSTAD